MILDAESLDQVGAVATLLERGRGRRAAGIAEDRALRLDRRAQHGRLRLVSGAGAALAELRRAAFEASRPARARARGGRLAPVRAPEDQPVVARGALHELRRLRGHLGAPAGRPGAARPRRHADRRAPAGALEWMLPWLPLVLALSANSPGSGGGTGFASNRAQCSPSSRARARRPTSAPTPAGRRGSSGWSSSASPPTTRGSGGTCARIRASGRSRCASPTSRPRSRRRSRSSRSCRRSAPRRSTAGAGRLRSRPLRPEPLGGGALRPGAELIHPDGDAGAARAELWPELLELLARRRAGAGALGLLEAIDPARSEGELQLGGRRPRGGRGARRAVARLARWRP